MKKKAIAIVIAMLIFVMGMTTVSAENNSYNAFEQFDTEKNDASSVPWKYVYSNDQGKTFTDMPIYQEVDWGHYWYPYEGSYVGIGVNNDVADKLEINTSDNNAEMSALAFVAPAKGDYEITGTVVNQWAQTADKFYIVKGTEKIYENALGQEEGASIELKETVSLEKGDVLYFYATTTSGWLSTYLDIVINSQETQETGQEEQGDERQEQPGDANQGETGDVSQEETGDTAQQETGDAAQEVSGDVAQNQPSPGRAGTNSTTIVIIIIVLVLVIGGLAFWMIRNRKK